MYLLRIVRGYLLNLHTTFGTRHQRHPLAVPVHDQSYIQLAANFNAFFNQTPVNGAGGNPQTPPVLQAPGADQLARENARYNINVNCIAPGPTDSPLMRDVEQQNPEMIKRMVKLVPFRRIASADEQASVISFLVSEDAGWLTGQVISTSGGLTMV